ncbi:MAG: hypothetical protein IH964_13185 [Candidatus Dadabacteria bacterium]|nr:hypothetical protein [Candidatus Dadabacteria bacterium]
MTPGDIIAISAIVILAFAGATWHYTPNYEEMDRKIKKTKITEREILLEHDFVRKIYSIFAPPEPESSEQVLSMYGGFKEFFRDFIEQRNECREKRGIIYEKGKLSYRYYLLHMINFVLFFLLIGIVLILRLKDQLKTDIFLYIVWSLPFVSLLMLHLKYRSIGRSLDEIAS